MQFPGAKGPEIEKKYYAVRDGRLRFSYSLRFDRPDPHGEENVEYEDFGPFWPRTTVGTWRNPGAGPKTENLNFLVLGGPK